MEYSIVFFIFLVNHGVWLKYCDEKKSIAILIDSTKEITSKDFDAQRVFIHTLMNEFKSEQITLSVQVYSKGCKIGKEKTKSFQNVFSIEQINSKLDTLQYNKSNITFDLHCTKTVLQKLTDTMKGKQEDKVAIAIAKYESAKYFIDEGERKKFKSNGTYYVAFVKNLKDYSNFTVFARHRSNIANIIPAIMKNICPTYIKEIETSKIIVSVNMRYQSVSAKYHSVSTEYQLVNTILISTSHVSPSIVKRIIESSTTHLPLKPSATVTRRIPKINSTGLPVNITFKEVLNNSISGTKIRMTSAMRLVMTSVMLTPSISSPSSVNTSVKINTTETNTNLVHISSINSMKTTYYTNVNAVTNTFVTSNFIRVTSMLKSSFPNSTLEISLSNTALPDRITTLVLPTTASDLPNTILISATTTHGLDNSTWSTPTHDLDNSTWSRFLSNTTINASLSFNTYYISPTFTSTKYILTTTISSLINQSLLVRPSIVTISLQKSNSTVNHTHLVQLYSSTVSAVNQTISVETSKLETANRTMSVQPFSSTLVVANQTTTKLNNVKAIVSQTRSSLSVSVVRGSTTPYLSMPLNKTVTSTKHAVNNYTAVIPKSMIPQETKMMTTKINAQTSVLAASTNILASVTPSMSVVDPVSSPTSVVESSIPVIIPWKKLVKDIEEFTHLEITKDLLKDELWIEQFVINSSIILNNINHDETDIVAEESIKLVSFIEQTLLKVGQELPINKKFKYSTKSLVVEINAVNPLSFNGYIFPRTYPSQSTEAIHLSETLFKNKKSTGKVAIVGMTYQTPPVMKRLRKGFVAVDKVLSISMYPPLQTPLHSVLSYNLRVTKNNFSAYQCVFWNNSDWNTFGCNVSQVQGDMVTCTCNHMTSFSVLMQVADYEIPSTHVFILNIITYIGCGASIFACILLILSYMMCGHLMKVDRNVIHVNLAFAIALANSFFITADSVHKYKNICLGVSIGMLYSYLASFFWMLVEGIHVYLMIVKVFKSSRKMTVYMIIGWVLPAIIVALTSFKFHDHFIRDDFCWISTDHYVIWVFVGPSLLILLINSGILIATLNASHKMSVDDTEFKRLQRIAKLTLLLMPIFGLTWVFGILAVNKQLIFFQYMFTGVNSFQGVFIFICYCLMNNEVKREYQRVRTKSQYSTSKSTGSSDYQFSTYIQPYPRRRLKKSLSTDDNLAAVQLTKFDVTSPTYLKDNGSANVSDSLTKRLKKNYSIELLELQQKEAVYDGSGDEGSVCSLLPSNGQDYHIASSNFLRIAPTSDRISSTSELTGDLNSFSTETFQDTNGVPRKTYRV